MAEAQPGSREQALAEQALHEALRAVAQPQLSPFFGRRLTARLAGERRRRRRRRLCRRALQLYWLLAAAASAGIILKLPAAAGAFATSTVLLATLACGAILPVGILLIVLREDPVELVFETLDRLA